MWRRVGDGSPPSSSDEIVAAELAGCWAVLARLLGLALVWWEGVLLTEVEAGEPGPPRDTL